LPHDNLAGKLPDNTSGTGNNALIPAGIDGWSWGAFLLNWIWAIANKTWIGMLALVPCLGLAVIVYLGINGRKLAWQNRQWASVEEFHKVQKRWSIAGVLLNILFMLAIFAVLRFGHFDFVVR
jgi:hypothetical protein